MGALTTATRLSPRDRATVRRSPFPILFASGRALSGFNIRCECGHVHSSDGLNSSVRYESASVAIVAGVAVCPRCTLHRPVHERITALDGGITLEHRHGDEWVFDGVTRDAAPENVDAADPVTSAPLSPMDWIRGIARMIALIARRGR